MPLRRLRSELAQLASPERAALQQRYFKTGPGEYAEGDRFLGLTVPQVRALVKRYRELSLPDTTELLHSPIHEERLLALLLLVHAYRQQPQRVYDLYLANTRFINNWDLVDSSAEHIVGAFLFDQAKVRRRSPTAPSWDRRSPEDRGDLRSAGVARSGDRPQRQLVRLARSQSLWERRIAVLATFHFIKRGEFAPTLRMARQLLGDREDLIHKAVGWMLREVGKRDVATAESFLNEHYRQMPRTMLRYAIEKFPQAKRLSYLRGTMPSRR
jgi:3-methyladenine DNA glycosylase AlkD